MNAVLNTSSFPTSQVSPRIVQKEDLPLVLLLNSPSLFYALNGVKVNLILEMGVIVLAFEPPYCFRLRVKLL